MTDTPVPEAPPRGALARIIAAHRREAEAARDRSPILSRAWERALRHAAAPFKGFALVPDAARVSERVGLSEALAALPEYGIVAAVEDREGNRGLIALSHGAVDALVEVQTTGQVEARELPVRPVTRIDEALSRDFLDFALAALAHETDGLTDRDWPARLTYGSLIIDRSQLTLLMPEQAYHVLSVDVTLGEAGDRSGEAVIVLPSRTRIPTAGPPQGADASDPDGQPADWQNFLRDAMQETEIALDAVLLRTTRSLNQLETLQEGDLIEFEVGDLASVTLESAGGHRVLWGRLGQLGGKRALRVATTAGGGNAPRTVTEPLGAPSALPLDQENDRAAAPGGPGIPEDQPDLTDLGPPAPGPPAPVPQADLPIPAGDPMLQPADLPAADPGAPDAGPAPDDALSFQPQSAPLNLDDLPG